MDAPLAIDSLMRRHFIAVEPDDSVDDVLRLMELARVRILPVVRHGVLVGIVRYRALALARLQDPPRGSLAAADALPVGALMELPGETLPARAPTARAARTLCESGHGCVPVVEAGESGPRLVGLVTETDLLEAAYGNGPRPPSAAPS